MDFIRHLIHCWGLVSTIASFFICLASALIFIGFPLVLIGLIMKYWPFMSEKYFDWLEMDLIMVECG